MLVKMKTLSAGPNGPVQPGQQVDVPPKEAKELIAGGYAEAVGGAADKPAAVKKAADEKPAADVPAADSQTEGEKAQ